MDLLILGGTAFLGRAVARAALARGIDVTCLARGTAEPPPGVLLVRGDRDLDDGLAPVAGRRWDAVLDVTRQPGQARRAVRDLDTEHFVLVSSASVYTDLSRERSEDAPTHEPLAGDTMTSPEDYGPAKVACEDVVRAACASWTVVRAGLIGGAEDASGRSGYYPWRFAHPTGDDVLVPPDLDFPVAMVDVEDLAAWLVDCAAERAQGTFNVTGPTTTLGAALDAARAAAGSVVVPRPVPAEVLRTAGVGGGMGSRTLPLWIDDPEWRWFATLDCTAAREVGLRHRPLEETFAAALAYEETGGGPQGAGLTDEQERDLRALL